MIPNDPFNAFVFSLQCVQFLQIFTNSTALNYTLFCQRVSQNSSLGEHPRPSQFLPDTSLGTPSWQSYHQDWCSSGTSSLELSIEYSQLATISPTLLPYHLGVLQSQRGFTKAKYQGFKTALGVDTARKTCLAAENRGFD